MNQIFIYCITTISLVIIWYIIWVCSKFASRAEFNKTVKQSEDYFAGLTERDLYVRHANRHMPNARQAYYAKYLSAYRELSFIEKIKIAANLPTMPAKLDIQYLIVKLAPGVELDHPHTLGRCIMLTNDTINGDLYPDLKHIITHEIIHIYQRYNPEETTELLIKMGFKPVITNKINNELLASNPDVMADYSYLVDGQPHTLQLIYLPDGQQGNYTHGMADVLVSPSGEIRLVQFQHDLFQSQPNEIMAELIARYISQDPAHGTINPDWFKIINYWVNK